MLQLQSAFGVVALLGIAWALSESRREVSFRQAAVGLIVTLLTAIVLIKLPLVTPDEVVRLGARATISWYPPLLKWLGGSIGLPEPFGLRHSWADQPWDHRFMADDALRAATPILRAVHRAALSVLREHDVNLDKFNSRAGALSGSVQEASPKKADKYDA